MNRSKATIVEASAGRNREIKQWAVALTFEAPGFGRTVRQESVFTKFDDERFWEDENGWYLEPGSPIVNACEAAVAKFTPWKVDAT